jgi:hypothetical protein
MGQVPVPVVYALRPSHTDSLCAYGLERSAAALAANSTAASPPPQNIRYALNSCSRDFLLVCRPIDALKTGQICYFGAFGKRWEHENRLKTANLPVLEPFLMCISGCRPIEYRGSSYEI